MQSFKGKEIFVNLETKKTYDKLEGESMRNFLELNDFQSVIYGVPQKEKFSITSLSSYSALTPGSYQKILKRYYKDALDAYGNTLLHAAAYHGKFEVMATMLELLGPEKFTSLVRQKNKNGLDVMHLFILYTANHADNNNAYQIESLKPLFKHVDLSALVTPPSELKVEKDGSIELTLTKEKKITVVRDHNYLQFALQQKAPEGFCKELLDATRPNYKIKGEKIKTKGGFLIDLSMHELAGKLAYDTLFGKLPKQTPSYAGTMSSIKENIDLKPWGLMSQYVRDLNKVKLDECLQHPKVKKLINHREAKTQKTLLRILAEVPVINVKYENNIPIVVNMEYDEKTTRSIQTKMLAEMLCSKGAIVGRAMPILAAVSNGNLELAKYLKSKDADLTASDENDNNILHCAVLSGNAEMLEWVLGLGLDFYTLAKDKNKNNKVPLKLSIKLGYYHISKVLMAEYVKNGISSTSVVNSKDKLLRRSYLSQTVAREDLEEFLNTLLVKKAKDKIKFASKDLNKQTFLHILCAKNLSNFLYRDNPNPISALTEKVLKTFTDEEVVKYLVPLLKKQDKDGNTPFHLILNHSTKDRSEDKLFVYLWDIFASQAKDNSFLHIANKDGQTVLHLICALNKVDLLTTKLFALIWNIQDFADMVDVDGNTIWHLAVSGGHAEIIEKLMSHGVHASQKLNNHGNSFLHEIILRKDLKLWNLLLDKMHPTVFDQLMWQKNNSGQNALHLIMANNSLTDNGEKAGEKFFHALVQKRTDAYVFNTPAAKEPDGNDMQPIHFAICGGLSGIVQHYFDKGQQALVFSTQRELHYPAMVGNKAMFDLLVENLPEVAAPTILNFNFKEATPIMASLRSGNRPIFLDLQKNTSVKVFSPYDFIKPNSNAQNFDTILHLAVENSADLNMAEDETYLSKVLIKVKGIVNAAVEFNNIQEIFGCIMFLLWPNTKGQTAFFLAAKRGDEKILEKLFAELLPLVSRWLGMQVSQSFPEAIGNDDVRKILKKCRDEHSIGNINQSLEDILYSFVFLQADAEQGNTCIHEAVFAQKKEVFKHILNLPSKEMKDLVRFKEMLKIRNKAQQTVVHAAAMVFSDSPEYFSSLTDELRVKDKAFFKDVMLMQDAVHRSPIDYMANVYFQLEAKKAQNPESKKAQDTFVLFVNDMLPFFDFSIEAAIEWALDNKQNELLSMLLKTCDEELFVAGFAHLLNGMVASVNIVGLERLMQMLEEKEELRDKIKQSDEIMSSIKSKLFDMFTSNNRALEACSEKLIKVICDQEMTFPFYAAAYDVDLLNKYFDFIAKKPQTVFELHNKNSQTLMHVAIQYGNERAAKLMFSVFAKDENAKEFATWFMKADGFAKPTMAYAVKTGMMFVLMQARDLGIPYSVEANTQYKRTLIDEWAELNEQKLSGRYDQSTAAAVIKEMGKVLITEFKSFIGKKNAYGKAPVHVAAENSNHTVLQILAENNANFLQLTKSGELALHFALRNDDAKSVEIITRIMIISMPKEKVNQCNTVIDFLESIRGLSNNIVAFPLANQGVKVLNDILREFKASNASEVNPPAVQPAQTM